MLGNCEKITISSVDNASLDVNVSYNISHTNMLHTSTITIILTTINKLCIDNMVFVEFDT